MNERDIFLAALDYEDLLERNNYLREACGERPELLESVQALLAAHESVSAIQFLVTPALQQIGHASPSGNKRTITAESDLSGGFDATLAGDTRGGSPEAAGSTSDDRLGASNDWEDNRDGEIPLGFLQPSTQPGSLGRLGHYEILEVIGRGAFGTVLKAFDDRLERVVAIKVLAPEMAVTSPARKRFLREARSSAQVRHENVVSIYAVEDDPIPYLVMEYIPGQTLQQRLDEHGPLDLPDALRLGKQIADGLSAAHDRQLIHRDVKPGNILLDTTVDDHVKITDFGLARTADDASMTQSGMIAGTPMYMAPEQALGQKLDQRSDLFSFGSVLYQMLSGRPPFRATSTVAVLKRVVEEKPRPISEIIPEVPSWMCRLIDHLHAKDPDQRYGSAKEVSALLARCLEDVKDGRQPQLPDPLLPADFTTVQLAKSVRARDKKKPSRNPLVIGAILLLLLVVSFGVTETYGVTRLASTVIRLTMGAGTLEIETDDPNLKISVNGDAVTILDAAGVAELTLRPGQHLVTASKDGQPMRQQVVTITRNGRTAVRMTMAPAAPVARAAPVSSSAPVSSAAPEAATPSDTTSLSDIATRLMQDWSLDETLRVGPEVDRMLVEGGFDDRDRDNVEALAAAFGRGADWRLAGKLLDVYLETHRDRLWRWADRCYVAASIEDWANYEHGVGQFVSIAESFPDDIHVNIVAVVLLSSHVPTEGRLSKARQFAEHLAKRWPDDTETLHAHAWLQYATGDTASAQQYLERIPDEFGNRSFRIRKTLLAAKCAAQTGDNEQAEELLNQASQWLLPVRTSGDFGDRECWTVARVLALLRNAEFDVRGSVSSEQVYRELKRRNPRFAGKWWRVTVEHGEVTTLQFCTDHVTDISPVKALPHLRSLEMHGDQGNGSLADLSPLKGMKLTSLAVPLNQVVDLSPLRGMPLENLQLMGCPVSDLTPLESMPLRSLDISRRNNQLALTPLAGLPLVSLCLDCTPVTDLTALEDLPLESLRCYDTPISDLSPLHKMRLVELHIGESNVSDLSPIKRMPLKRLECDFQRQRDAPILREIRTLQKINGKPAAKFWEEVEDA